MYDLQIDALITVIVPLSNLPLPKLLYPFPIHLHLSHIPLFPDFTLQPCLHIIGIHIQPTSHTQEILHI